jgi:hypothetical protein
MSRHNRSSKLREIDHVERAIRTVSSRGVSTRWLKIGTRTTRESKMPQEYHRPDRSGLVLHGCTTPLAYSI